MIQLRLGGKSCGQEIAAIEFPVHTMLHLILRAFTSHNWEYAREQLEILAPNSNYHAARVWDYQICADCKTVTPSKTYCPIVFCCINCASSLEAYGNTNRSNWTQAMMFRFTKLPPAIAELMTLALAETYRMYSLWPDNSKNIPAACMKEL